MQAIFAHKEKTVRWVQSLCLGPCTTTPCAPTSSASLVRRFLACRKSLSAWERLPLFIVWLVCLFVWLFGSLKMVVRHTESWHLRTSNHMLLEPVLAFLVLACLALASCMKGGSSGSRPGGEPVAGRVPIMEALVKCRAEEHSAGSGRRRGSSHCG